MCVLRLDKSNRQRGNNSRFVPPRVVSITVTEFVQVVFQERDIKLTDFIDCSGGQCCLRLK